jgi:hypothetical protein
LEPFFHVVRSGASAQSGLTMRWKAQLKSGPFAPRELPRFFATTSRSDFRPQPLASYGFLARVAESCGPRRRAGSPRDLDQPFDSRPPQSPRQARPGCAARCLVPVGDRLQQIRKTGRPHWSNEAETGSLSLGLGSSPSKGDLPLSPRRASAETGPLRTSGHPRVPTRS